MTLKRRCITGVGTPITNLRRLDERLEFFLASWRHQMETFSALLALCAGKSLVTGEFPSQRPVKRSFDVFFHMCLNKRLSKQSWGWWFETPSPSLWRHRNEDPYAKKTVSFRLIQPELWRHGMEAFFALLVLWEEQFSGHRIPLTKCQQCRILMFSLWVVWTSCWIHSRLAGDLKHPNAYVASL